MGCPAVVAREMVGDLVVGRLGVGELALTFEEAFDEAAHPEVTARQSADVTTRADKVVFDKVRFLRPVLSRQRTSRTSASPPKWSSVAVAPSGSKPLRA